MTEIVDRASIGLRVHIDYTNEDEELDEMSELPKNQFQQDV